MSSTDKNDNGLRSSKKTNKGFASLIECDLDYDTDMIVKETIDEIAREYLKKRNTEE